MKQILVTSPDLLNSLGGHTAVLCDIGRRRQSLVGTSSDRVLVVCFYAVPGSLALLGRFIMCFCRNYGYLCDSWVWRYAGRFYPL